MLHEKIRKLREFHQWTQEEMAERTTLSRNGYANIERGESIPSIESLEKIASVFGIKVEELMSSDERNLIISVVNGKGDYHTNYYSHTSAENELSTLHQIIKHKDEMLIQKDTIIDILQNENQLLKEMLDILKKQN